MADASYLPILLTSRLLQVEAGTFRKLLPGYTWRHISEDISCNVIPRLNYLPN
jgi:hypothetical protein